MKTILTSKYLKPFLFCSLVICSISCTLFLNSVNSDLKNDAPSATVINQEEEEEVSMPDVFAIKNLIEKIIKHLPAS